MSKSILVIDTPESCKDCNLKFTDEYSDYCPYKKADVYDYVQNNTQPNWCPLTPIPERINLNQYVENGAVGLDGIVKYQYAQGWNDCLEEIINKEEI
jgi:hypothetical protein